MKQSAETSSEFPSLISDEAIGPTPYQCFGSAQTHQGS